MITLATLKDRTHHNTARIESGRGPAYYGGHDGDQIRVTLSADYNHGMVYHVSVYADIESALAAVKRFGTWEIKSI